jgi:hypothetical protein
VTDPDGTVGYIRSLMEQARIEPNVYPAPEQGSHPASEPPAQGRPAPLAPPPALRTAGLQRNAVLRSEPSHEPAFLELQAPGPSPAPPARATGPAPLDETPLSRPSRSTWERLVITPDIEIHVRRPLKPLDIKRADHLERYARELFQDEP